MPIYASSEQTYEAIIAATGELAAEQGFATLSTRAIASRAGVNSSSIHYHFGGKEKLFEAVLRRVLEGFARHPLQEVLQELLPLLETPEGQSRAVSEVVRHHISTIFSCDCPDWYSRVLYQAMQYATPLQQIVLMEFIEHEAGLMRQFFQRIAPDADEQTLSLYHTLLLAPILFHSDYKLPILHMLGTATYPESYMQRLEHLTTLQLQRLLGLPEGK